MDEINNNNNNNNNNNKCCCQLAITVYKDKKFGLLFGHISEQPEFSSPILEKLWNKL
jgi:hypothetical protein